MLLWTGGPLATVMGAAIAYLLLQAYVARPNANGWDTLAFMLAAVPLLVAGIILLIGGLVRGSQAPNRG